MTVSDWVVAYVVPMVLPVLVGSGLLWFGRRVPALALHPARTALALFYLLVVLNAFDTVGGDLVGPTLGGIVSIAVCVAIYVRLRRRLAPNESLPLGRG